MHKDYFTTHRAVAAVLLCKGTQSTKVEKEYDSRKNREVTKIFFDCQIDEGRKIADDYFANGVTVDARDFYEKLGDAGRLIRSAQ